jgi:urocanate hydratase
MSFSSAIEAGIPAALPAAAPIDPSIPRAPARPLALSEEERRLALANALRYLPVEWHETYAPELAEELAQWGRIYMHRLRPDYPMYARPIHEYPARCAQAAAIMHMIQNNLDPAVAQHPYELITYGGNGTVFQNWAQYLLVMKYLSQMTEEQTLVIYSGHPLGLFPSHAGAPRVVVTNGMVIPNYSSGEDYARLSALGVTSYGQMTAGSYMYIGPQGIVHGTTITLLNAGRLYLNAGSEGLRGKIFVTAGLGGMSGAQAKAAVIAGAVCVVAEVNPDAAEKRHRQGWVDQLSYDLDETVTLMESARSEGRATSIAYVGNVIDLWEHLAREDISIDLGSDQTSLHIPFSGGYYPAGLSVPESDQLMAADPERFKELVQSSLVRHAAAVGVLADRGMFFWDYGNAFLLEASRAGAEVSGDTPGGFRYPSYVEDIMGPLCFDFGFGPFRWVCTSANPEDLAISDQIAADVVRRLHAAAPPEIATQYADNLRWIEHAQDNNLVVGSQARILYADDEGRRAIASAFNDAVASGQLSAPVVLGRDHHDVSGTDSPWRETANIYDGSRFCADMAIHNVIGDSFRGATWVSIHNGGGVGWGEVINGGFGFLLDGSPEAQERVDAMLHWDVNNGVARRAWARNEGANFATKRAMEANPLLEVTLPNEADSTTVSAAIDAAFS